MQHLAQAVGSKSVVAVTRRQRVVASCSSPTRPSLALSSEDTFTAHWDALRSNDDPHTDAGLETLYAFADIDLFLPRSTYFGLSQDLGQFERFRRCFHSPAYRVLLSHVGLTVLSVLNVSETEVKQRVRVRGFRMQEAATYCLTLRRRLGGRLDGVWLGASLIAFNEADE